MDRSSFFFILAQKKTDPSQKNINTTQSTRFFSFFFHSLFSFFITYYGDAESLLGREFKVKGFQVFTFIKGRRRTRRGGGGELEVGVGERIPRTTG